eukprot:2571235-Prymnesium_polylepis.1
MAGGEGVRTWSASWPAPWPRQKWHGKWPPPPPATGGQAQKRPSVPANGIRLLAEWGSPAVGRSKFVATWFCLALVWGTPRTERAHWNLIDSGQACNLATRAD